MSKILYSTSNEFNPDELKALYDSVGWSSYTKDIQKLSRAIQNSDFVISARDSESDQLIGLARTISDRETICYIQDILVHPEYQRHGVGRVLMHEIVTHYAELRQMVLITDSEPRQKLFYESLNFIEGSEYSPEAIKTFLLFR
ncbi:MAG: GNAT family N-acetyltransferase [Microbacteriaceae bacterium]